MKFKWISVGFQNYDYWKEKLLILIKSRMKIWLYNHLEKNLFKCA